MEQQEQRWARRWTWVIVVCSLLSWFMPIAHISGDGAVSWFFLEADIDMGTFYEWVRYWGALLLAVLALISLRMGWLGRAILLVSILVLNPVSQVVEHIQLIQDPGFEPLPTNDVVGYALDTLIAAIGIGVIPAVAHGRKRGLLGRSYRTMTVAAIVMLLAFAFRYFVLNDPREYAESVVGSNEPPTVADVVYLFEWAVYLLYVVLAVVTGMLASERGNRWVSMCSRVALLASFLWVVRFDSLAGDSTQWQVVLTIAVQEGSFHLAQAASAGLAAASCLHWRAARRAEVEASAFD